MSAKSDRLGLLSKMALFVRNPTKDWSDLDQPEPSAEAVYDKQALKAMIERKRQNDFVRRREFDQLRKLRIREASGAGGAVRPSVFQTSMVTDPDGRAVTLKKIDDIEAQMSKQWWKGREEAADADSADFPVAKTASTAESHPLGSEGPAGAGSFATTQNAQHILNDAEFIETEMGVGASHASAHLLASGARKGASDRNDVAEAGFSASTLFAIDDMATDPELEEAAIRFANGDDTGAEDGLLTALRGPALVPDVALSWTAALLDFYRATEKRGKFDQAVLEFGYLFGGATPVWESIASARAVAYAPLASAASGALASDAVWECPAELTLDGMERLRDVMSSQPMPWHLGWQNLVRVSDEAMPLLAGLFSSLCDEPVTLRFSGEASLVQTLRAMAPSGDRGVNPVWWAVRLDALRTMQLQDEFELAALDYCVTYEVAPPVWVPARCQFERVQAAEQVPAGNVQPPPAAEDASLELRGEVLGDATPALTAGGRSFESGELITVACHGLVRVDFSAAGSILNWVAMRQSNGCRVQFQGVHRLVAAFFNVIGINEHARVAPRSM